MKLVDLEKDIPHKKAIIGLSGGVDSSCLVYLCAHLKQSDPTWVFSAVHVNHHLQPASDLFQATAQTLCTDLKIPLEVVSVTLEPKLGNIQARARAARFKALSKLIPPDVPLLLAHHQNDVVETFLMRLARGAGLVGLGAMQKISRYDKLILIRPLLAYSKKNIVEFGKEHNLCFITDPSNAKSNYDRNFLRNEALPLLKRRYPSLEKSLLQSAENCLADQQLLSELIQPYVSQAKGRAEGTLSIRYLNILKDSLFFAVVREWLKAQAILPPGRLTLRHLKENVLLARKDANPIVQFGQHQFRRYRDDLYCLENKKRLLPTEYHSAHGESVRYFGQSVCGAKFKKWFQKNHIPPWERAFFPLRFKAGKFEGMCT